MSRSIARLRKFPACSLWTQWVARGLVLGLSTFGLATTGFAQESDSGESSEQKVESKSDLPDQERKEYTKHLKKGKRAYAEEDLETAFRELKTAHDIYAKPSILFNLGLISEKQGELERAAKYYREFIGSPGIGLEKRKRASERLAAVREILDATGEEREQKKAETKDEKTDLMRIHDEAISAADNEETSGSSTEEPTGSADSSSSAGDSESTGAVGTGSPGGTGGGAADTSRPRVDYNWPIYTSYGVGVASLVGGVVSLELMNDRIEKAKAAGTNSEDAPRHLKYERQASTFATTSLGLFVGGGALVGLGTYFVVRKSAQAERQQQKAAEARGPTAPQFSLSVGKEYSGVRMSLSF